MTNKLSWQRLQVSMNNFQINKLMSFTDIKNKLKMAIAGKSDQKDANAKQIAKLIKGLDSKDDFIVDNKHNQSTFKQVQKAMKPLVGYAKVANPITNQLNNLFKQASKKNPEAMKQFNISAHKKDHMSAQQAMLNIFG